MSTLCGICNENESKYKCPKCSIRYCSLACYKDTEKHQHSEEKESITEGLEDNKKTGEAEQTSEKKVGDRSPTLRTESFNELYQETPEIQELLKYNTVKFHLAKVYRILKSNVSSSETGLNSESKKQLAVDYLNTLRYGGIHYNEAIEEFCQISLESGKLTE